MMIQKVFFFAENWYAGSLEHLNVQNFRKFEGFFGKKLKKIDFNFENSEILFKIALLQSPFFRKKKIIETLHTVILT
mgnify:CR=1 FL=1